MAKHWKLPLHDAARIAQLSRDLSVPSFLAQLLLNRGIADPNAARTFLSPKLRGLHDPELLPGAVDSARMVVDAIRAGKTIVIYGDYDVDGVTGTSILLLCLRVLGANVKFYVPHRLEEGYGLNEAALSHIREEMKADLVITVDCGIASVQQAKTARALGLDLIISDHHRFAEQLPEAACLVHPKLPGGCYPFDGLSGAGVAFKIAWQIARTFEGSQQVSPRLRSFLMHALALASLGTIADVVPLSDENRILVYYGLTQLNDPPSVGLAALIKASSKEKNQRISAEDVAFGLAPRINAAGRLGQASLAVELLTTQRQDRAEDLANYLNGQNEQRQTVERRIYRQAKELAELEHDLDQDRAIVLGKRDWHAGVIGIVASRLVERFWRPTILVAITDQHGQGSGRSVPGFDLHRALQNCRDHLSSFGGHQMAAGIQIEANQLPAFRQAFCEYAAEHLREEQLVEQLRIDAEIPLADVNYRLIHYLDNLAPFGAGNRKPLLMSARVKLAGEPKKVGGGERHLSFQLLQNGRSARAIGFGMAERADELNNAERLDIAFSPQLNTFQGRTTVDLHIKDFRISSD